jgi:hypothetical protein
MKLPFLVFGYVLGMIFTIWLISHYVKSDPKILSPSSNESISHKTLENKGENK